MSKLKVSCGFAAAAIALAFASSANAQATRTWVSGVGDDVNPCSRTAPCKTFAGAISKTARGGEISVLDPGGFGNVTITKSITLNGTPGAGFGSILVPAASTGVIINITDPTDTLRTVRLNWLDINGAGTGANGIRILNSGLSGSTVVVENSFIDGFTARGISDERNTGGKLFVRNTTVRNTVGAGIITFPAGGSTTKIDSSIDRVSAFNTGAGFAALSGGKMVVTNSVASGGAIGLDAEGAGTEMLVTHTTISSNGQGILGISGATVRLAHSDVAFNTTGINGTVNSFTNNRFVSNGGGGTITAIGGPSSDTGQQ